MKQLYVKTYGCQMNVYDSERMEEMMAPFGYTVSHDPKEADLVIFNTCHIREKAEDKLFSDLGRFRKVKETRSQEGKNTILVVAGCTGQALGQGILKRAPYVDAVVGPQTYHHLPETVAKILRHVDATEKRGAVTVGFPEIAKFDQLPQTRGLKGASAFLSIQEGCDKFCRYCVVPYTRGAEFSRPVADLLAEAKQLVAKGAKELVLLGQNVNAYHGKTEDGQTWGLGRLFYALAEFPIERLRYMTSHPRDVDAELIAAHKDIPALMPFLHLPVQSGSDRILAHMNRQYTTEFYLKILDAFRTARPDMAFSSDFIVGYPGETDEDFAHTCALVEKVGYAQAYSFKFSPRPGTPAALAKNQVEESVKKERLAHLQTLLNRDQYAFNARMVGQDVPILLERKGKKAHQWIGQTPYMQSVHIMHETGHIGDLLSVRLEAAHDNSLTGVLRG